MTRDKFYFGMLVLVFLSIIIWTSYAMDNDEKEAESYRVSVIVNDSNNDRWIALRQGLEQAARDYNIDLNYVSTGRLSSVEEEIAIINREMENGAEGIIVQMVSSEENILQMMETTVRPAMILLESDVKPENQYSLAGPDNTEIGRAVADAIKRDFDKELDGKRIGILSGNLNRLSMHQRLQGLKDGLADAPIEIVWEHSHDDRIEGNQVQYDQLEQVDILIALENDETERMVDLMLSETESEEEDEETLCLYGVGYSEKAVYYLDKGVISTLVVPNEFNLGYQSMRAVADQLKYHLDKSEDSQVDYLVIDRVNMYDEENQKVLFPIVQ